MKKSLLLLVLSIIVQTAMAGTMGRSNWTWLATVSGGAAWATYSSATQTFFLAHEIEKTFVPTRSNNALAAGELFLGFQKEPISQWQGQLGLALALSGDARLSGIIWDDANPQFDNHSYQYRIRHSRVALKGKLIADRGCWLMPWISGSLGIGFNRAFDYNNTPLIFEALPNNNFANKSIAALSYTLGIGVQRAINTNWQVGVGYEFADWGASELGLAPQQTLNTGLRLNHLYTNGILFNLTYIA
jgi:opacity protein-like surface antigen